MGPARLIALGWAATALAVRGGPTAPWGMVARGPRGLAGFDYPSDQGDPQRPNNYPQYQQHPGHYPQQQGGPQPPPPGRPPHPQEQPGDPYYPGAPQQPYGQPQGHYYGPPSEPAQQQGQPGSYGAYYGAHQPGYYNPQEAWGQEGQQQDGLKSKMKSLWGNLKDKLQVSLTRPITAVTVSSHG